MTNRSIALALISAFAVSCGSENKSENPPSDTTMFGDQADQAVQPDLSLADQPDPKDQEQPDSAAPDASPLDHNPQDQADQAGLPDLSDLNGQDLPTDQADTSTPTEPSVLLTGPTAWQRGPVSLFAKVVTIQAGTQVQFLYGPTAPTQACTPLTGFGDISGPVQSGTHRFAWNSMADTQEDTLVHLQARLLLGSDVVAESNTITIQLFNSPSRIRAAILTNAINGSNIVRPMTYTPGAGFVYDNMVLNPGESPKAVTFHPGGLAAVTSDQGSDQLTFYRFTSQARFETMQSVATPGRYFDDIAWSEDGTELYLLDFNPTPDAGVYVLSVDPSTGMPGPAVPVKLTHHYAGNKLELLPENRGYVVLEGSEDDPGSGISVSVVYAEAPSSPEEYWIPGDGSIPSVLAISPDGTQMLAGYYNLFGDGDKVMLFHLSEAGPPEFVADLDVYDPADAEWTEDGSAILLAEGQGDKVTLLKIGGGLALTKGASLTMGLPYDIMSLRWGADADLFMVPTVSGSTGISSVKLVAVDSGAPVLKGSFDLGDGIEHLIDSAGIQP